MACQSLRKFLLFVLNSNTFYYNIEFSNRAKSAEFIELLYKVN
jgi:hypothetical protein